jgi:hypothetical protein
VLPKTKFELAVLTVDDTIAVLLTFKPGPRISTLIWHHVDPVSLTPIQLIEAFIASAVRIILNAEPVDLRILPITGELFTIGPFVSPEAFNDSVDVVSGISLIIWPLLYAISIALSITVEAVETHTVRVAFFAKSVLDVLLEHALVDEEIDVTRDSFAVLHVVGPLALISLSLHVSELSVAVGTSQIPCALIAGTVSEFHSSTPVTESVQPLAVVMSS